MAVTRFRCPECEAVLKLARALEPGKRIKCPKCAAVVTVPAEEEHAGAVQVPARPRKPAPPQDDEDAEEQEERPRKRRKQAKKQKRSPVVLWSLIGGGSAVAVLALVLVLILTGGGGGGPKGGGLPKGGGQPKGDERAKLAEQIVGKWQATPESRPYRSVEYRKDGTVSVVLERTRGDGTYEVMDGVTVKLTLTKIDPPLIKGPLVEEHMISQIGEDSMEAEVGGKNLKFSRAKGGTGGGQAKGPTHDIHEICKEAKADRAAAEAKYKGKRITVGGLIDGAQGDLLLVRGSSGVTATWDRAACTLRQGEAAKIAGLPKDSLGVPKGEVVVEGTVGPFAGVGVIELADAVIVSVK